MDRDLAIALRLTEPSPMTDWGMCAVCSDVIEPGAVTCVSVEFPGWPTIRFHVACYVGFIRLATDFHQRVVLGPAWTSGPPA